MQTQEQTGWDKLLNHWKKYEEKAEEKTMPLLAGQRQVVAERVVKLGEYRTGINIM